jgi:hypothetical protein
MKVISLTNNHTYFVNPRFVKFIVWLPDGKAKIDIDDHGGMTISSEDANAMAILIGKLYE